MTKTSALLLHARATGIDDLPQEASISVASASMTT